ncbi:hypothetical protein [Geothermobacter hydrogeniphilus]|uniref:hypothetical protein n=1 Tax=Geothermobacter hydrogeniphilus TaxID=1969733 RepID=UPI00111C6E8C|nr:hypothetical protein [Geothermobacter hydrogeniphilus]
MVHRIIIRMFAATSVGEFQAVFFIGVISFLIELGYCPVSTGFAECHDSTIGFEKLPDRRGNLIAGKAVAFCGEHSRLRRFQGYFECFQVFHIVPRVLAVR